MVVNRLIDITEGDIRIGEESVRDRDVTGLRRGIGYVIQQTGLFPHDSRRKRWPRFRSSSAGTGDGSRPASTSCSTSSTYPQRTTGRATPRSCPAASGSASGSPAPSPPTRP